MGSSVHGITFFSNDQLNQLKEYTNTPLLLHELSHLWSWNNHSILRVLVGSCDEAVKLLDEFDCHIDSFEPISSYPVYKMFPMNATTHTLLEMKCDKENMEMFTLQKVINMGSLIVAKCDLTHHCLQLLRVAHKFYWSVPKCVLHLISAKVLQHCNCLYKNGILGVKIHPHIQIDISKMVHLEVSFDTLVQVIVVLQVSNCIKLRSGFMQSSINKQDV